MWADFSITNLACICLTQRCKHLLSAQLKWLSKQSSLTSFYKQKQVQEKRHGLTEIMQKPEIQAKFKKESSAPKQIFPLFSFFFLFILSLLFLSSSSFFLFSPSSSFSFSSSSTAPPPSSPSCPFSPSTPSSSFSPPHSSSPLPLYL